MWKQKSPRSKVGVVPTLGRKPYLAWNATANGKEANRKTNCHETLGLQGDHCCSLIAIVKHMMRLSRIYQGSHQ